MPEFELSEMDAIEDGLNANRHRDQLLRQEDVSQDEVKAIEQWLKAVPEEASKAQNTALRKIQEVNVYLAQTRRQTR